MGSNFFYKFTQILQSEIWITQPSLESKSNNIQRNNAAFGFRVIDNLFRVQPLRERTLQLPRLHSLPLLVCYLRETDAREYRDAALNTFAKHNSCITYGMNKNYVRRGVVQGGTG